MGLRKWLQDPRLKWGRVFAFWLGAGLSGVGAQAVPDNLTVTVEVDSTMKTLTLSKRSIRGSGFQLWYWNQANGNHLAPEGDLPPVRTYRGTVAGKPNTIVCAVLRPDGSMSVNAFAGKGYHWRINNVDVSDQLPSSVVASSREKTARKLSSSIDEYLHEGDCGGDHVAVSINSESTIAKEAQAVPPTFYPPSGGIKAFQFAFDLVFDRLTNNYGGSLDAAMADVEHLFNTYNHWMTRDTMLSPEIGIFMVHRDRFYDEALIGDNGRGHLGALNRTWRQTAELQALNWDCVHTFSTGIGLPPGIGGIAFLGQIGKEEASASINALFHENGHNWGAVHLVYGRDTMGGNRPHHGPFSIDIVLNKRLSEMSEGTFLDMPDYPDPLHPYSHPVLVSTPLDTAVDITPLANDYDANGDNLSISFFTDVSGKGGAVTQLAGTETLRYTPPAGYTGKDIIVYEVADITGLTNRELIFIEVLPEGLGAHYTFDEITGSIAADVSGNNHPGDLGSVTFQTATTQGVIGKAVIPGKDGIVWDSSSALPAGIEVGSGRDDYPFDQEALSSGNYFDPMDANYTLSFWFKPIELVGSIELVKKEWNSGQAVGFRLSASSTGIHATLRQFYGLARKIQLTWDNAPILSGSWYHVAFVINRVDETVRLYVNGQEAAKHGELLPGWFIFNGRQPLIMGSSSSGDVAFDDARVYYQALAPEVITDLMAPAVLPTSNPEPATGAVRVPPSDSILSWTSGGVGFEFGVYMGTDENAVRAATATSPEYQGRQVTTSFTPAALSSGTTYYWRVDEIKGNDVVVGDVWRFTTVIDPAQLLTDLHGRWMFDEGEGDIAHDASFRQHHGAIDGAVWEFGIRQGALLFDGQDDGIDLGFGPSLSGAGDFTLSAWVRTSERLDQVIYQQRDSSTDRQWFVWLEDNGAVRFKIDDQFDFTSPTDAPVNDGQWHWVAVVRKGLRGVIYIDGKAIAAATGAGVTDLNDQLSVTIGYDSRNSDKRFSGHLDDIQLWSRALNEGELDHLSRQPNPVTIEFWDGISGSTVTDLTSDPDYPEIPDETISQSVLAAPRNRADNYGGRMQALIVPPETGDYTFTITSDDASELWLSSDASPANTNRIAFISGWTNVTEFDKFPDDQLSAPQSLVARTAYYVEILWKEGGGGDHATIWWSGPGIDREPISLPHLRSVSESETNEAPVLLSNSPVPLGEAIDGQAFSDVLNGLFFDPNFGDILTFTKPSGPEWLTVSSTGLLQGTPTLNDFGVNTIQVEVADSQGQSATATIEIEVVGDFRAPRQPTPPDQAFEQSVGATTLTWLGDDAYPGVQFDVYFGPDVEAVTTADTSDATVYQGRQTESSWIASDLAPGTLYYWRIDEITPKSVLISGVIWEFTTAVDPLQLRSKLHAHWNFNESSGDTVYDSSCQQRHGTAVGATRTTGFRDGILTFDGIDDTIVFGSTPSLEGPIDFTLAAWIRTEADENQVILQQRDKDGVFGEYVFQVRRDGKLGFFIWRSRFQFNMTSGPGNQVNDGAWHHVVAVREGLSGHLYIDGRKVATTSGESIVSLNPTLDTFIGYDERDDEDYFAGDLDEVCMWTRALTDGEISYLTRGLTALQYSRFLGIGGNDIEKLKISSNFPGSPDATKRLASISAPRDIDDSYGARLQAILVPPTDGEYTFWLTSDDQAELFLNPATDLGSQLPIAKTLGATGRKTFDTFPDIGEQKSATQSLIAGQRYHLEALLKEGAGGDFLHVWWEGPGITRRVIGFPHLEPIAGALANVTPEFISDPIIKGPANADQEYFEVVASYARDVNLLDNLIFSKVSGPNWLTVDANGIIQGTPSNADAGLNTFVIQVSDPLGLSATSTLEIQVNKRYDPVTTPEPADQSQDIAGVPILLTWTGDSDAGVLYDVYLGTDLVGLEAANTAAEDYQGRFPNTQWVSPSLNIAKTYYWRVDLITPLGEVVTGPVWQFTTSMVANNMNAALVGWWKFEEDNSETANDASGQQRFGIVDGATSVSGIVGSALAFDGIDDKVNHGTRASLDGITDFTVAAWIKSMAAKDQIIMQQRNSGFNGAYQFRVRSNGQLRFFVFRSNNQFDFDSGADFRVNDGLWHHVVAVRQGVTGLLYIDGVLANSIDGTFVASLDGNIETAIGADIRADNKYFDGSIDEVQLWSRALDPTEIQLISANAMPVLRERWDNVNGVTIASLTDSPDYPDNPSVTDLTTGFSYARNRGSDFGYRFRALLVPPANGDYTFWLTSDDEGELYLSSDESPENAMPIASVLGWTDLEEFDKFPDAQESTPQSLIGGRRYYLEGLYKEEGGRDHFIAWWQGPGFERQPISIPDLQALESDLPENQPPEFFASPIHYAAIPSGFSYSGSIAGQVTDVDMFETLIFTKVFGPGWLTVAPNGSLSGTPTAADSGVNVFTISVLDSMGAEATANLEIEVLPPADLASDLVVFLPFENDTLDQSGRSNHGIATGEHTYSNGKLGQAIQLSGGQYVSLGIPSDLNFEANTDFSVAIWIKTAGFTSDPVIIGNKNWNSGNNRGWVIASETNKTDWQWNYRAVNGSRQDTTVEAIADDNWHHLVVTHDRDGGATFYQDGEKTHAVSIATATGSIDSGLPTVLGADGMFASDDFTAVYDDLMIWRRILGPNEISQLYNASFEDNGVQGQCETGAPISTAFTLSLKPGWNLLSLPLTVAGSLPQNIFQERNAGFLWCVEGSRLLQLSEVLPGQGFWVYLNSFVDPNLWVAGVKCRTTTHKLKQGWNIFGPQKEMILPEDQRLNPSIWQWNHKRFRKLPPGSTLTPGFGYFIHASMDFDLLME